MFGGPYGCGKTTLGRILARALLCERPTGNGDPCDTCLSCNSLLTGGTAEGYVEVDAATNSGKDHIRKIVEEIQFSTFSGRQRVYVFDESHRLSKDALDAMLKPMEDTVPGGQDKQLICIFCTTQPDDMGETVMSRCGPTFMVRSVSPERIGARLAEICDLENISYDRELLTTIASLTKCHLRDALKALEGIAMLGGVTQENVSAYLHLDLDSLYLDLLESLGKDPAAALSALEKLQSRRSPASIYERLAETALSAYQVVLGAPALATFRDRARIERLAASHGSNLLGIAVVFSSKPTKATAGALKLDLLQIHAELSSGRSIPIASPTAAQKNNWVPVAPQPAPAPLPQPIEVPSAAGASGSNHVVETPEQPRAAPEIVSSPKVVDLQGQKSGKLEGKAFHGPDDVLLSPAARGRTKVQPRADTESLDIPPDEFCRNLGRWVKKLSGSAGRSDVDSP